MLDLSGFDVEMDLRFTVQTRIQKPVNEVFDAVYNPKKLTKYFTTGGADGPLDEGKTVMWSFIDSGVKIPPFPVKVKKVVRNKLIQFSWEASEGVYDAKTGQMPAGAGYDTVVEMSFEPLNANETLVKIVEASGGLRKRAFEDHTETAKAGHT